MPIKPKPDGLNPDEITPNDDIDPNGDVPNKTQILPWMEVNRVGSPWLDVAVEGLKHWQEVAEYAVISSAFDGTPIYEELNARDDLEIKIIPGLKTSSIFADKRFDTSKQWDIVAEEVKKFTEASQSDTILFEHEGAYKNHRETFGYGWSVNHGKLYRSLKKLPQDINYIWYPDFIGMYSSPEVFEWHARIAVTANLAIKNIDFTDLTWQAPLDFYLRSLPGSSSNNKLKWIKKTISGESIPMSYFYGPGSRWWMDEEIVTILDDNPKKLIVYPGGVRWVDAAKIISGYIKEYNG